MRLSIRCATNKELKAMVKNKNHTPFYISEVKAEISRRGMFYLVS